MDVSATGVESPVGTNSAVPAVSIGLPVFQGEPFLHEALASLLSQDFRDFEIVASDNGSTDGTAEILRTAARQDHRVRVFEQPCNRGVSFNFRFVLEQARAPRFMWAAADDRWSPDWLAKLVPALAAADLSVRGAIRVFGDGAEVTMLSPPSLGPSKLLSSLLGDERDGRLHHLYGLFWTDRLRSVDWTWIEPRPFADVVLLQLLAGIGPMRVIDGPFSEVRVHQGSEGSMHLRGTSPWIRVLFPYSWSMYRDLWRATPVPERWLLPIVLPAKWLNASFQTSWRVLQKRLPRGEPGRSSR